MRDEPDAFEVLRCRRGGTELHEASARLHISQPPLTQQIRTLEREVNQELFKRSSRRISLTPAGEALLPEARRILERYQRLLDCCMRPPPRAPEL